MAERVSVVRQEDFDALAFLPPHRARRGQSLYAPLTPDGEAALDDVIVSQGRSRLRKGPLGVEWRQRFLQPVPYGVVLGHEGATVLASPNTHGDQRVRGLSIGIGEHLDPEDTSLRGGLGRGISEEAVVRVNGTIVDLPPRPTPEELHELFSTAPAAVLFDGQNRVGSVHLGVVYLLSPRDGVSVRLHGGASGNISSTHEKVTDLHKRAKAGEVQLAGWSKMVLEHVLKPGEESVVSTA